MTSSELSLASYYLNRRGSKPLDARLCVIAVLGALVVRFKKTTPLRHQEYKESLSLPEVLAQEAGFRAFWILSSSIFSSPAL